MPPSKSDVFFYACVLIINTEKKKQTVGYMRIYNCRLIPRENLAQAGKSHQNPVIT